MQRTNRAAAALLLLVALAAPVAAGAQDAAISGTVTDTTGLVLPGVTVEARDAAGDPAGTAVSDGAGRFTISALLPGAYAVTFTLARLSAGRAKRRGDRGRGHGHLGRGAGRRARGAGGRPGQPRRSRGR